MDNGLIWFLIIVAGLMAGLIVYLLPINTRKRYISYYDLCLDEISLVSKTAVRLEHRLKGGENSPMAKTYTKLGDKLSVYTLYRKNKLAYVNELFIKGKDEVAEHLNYLLETLDRTNRLYILEEISNDVYLYRDLIDFRSKTGTVIFAFNNILETSYDKYSKTELINLFIFIKYMVYIISMVYNRYGTPICTNLQTDKKGDMSK